MSQMRNRELLLELGKCDDPEEQKQDHYTIDLYKHNLAVFGSAQTGKSYLLKTLLLRIHQKANIKEGEEIYILDFGFDLYNFQELPYVRGYFDASNAENVRRVFKIVSDKLEENIQSLYKQDFGKAKHVTFIIDGLNQLFSNPSYEKYKIELARIARDGISKSITVIVTANNTTDGISKVLASFPRVIAFAMKGNNYQDLFSNSKKIDKPMPFEGRGLANDDKKIYEIQVYCPFQIGEHQKKLEKEEKDRIEKQTVKDVIGNMRNLLSEEKVDKYMDSKIKIIGNELKIEDWNTYTGTSYIEMVNGLSDGEVIVGLDYYDLNPVILDLMEAEVIAIYGKRGFGKSNLLSLLLEGLVMLEDTYFLFWDDKRKGLEVPCVLRWMNAAMRVDLVYSFDEFKKRAEEHGFGNEKKQDLQYSSTRTQQYEYLNNSFSRRKAHYSVFVVQSGQIWSKTEALSFLLRCKSDLEHKLLIIYSDARRIATGYLGTNPLSSRENSISVENFNSSIKHAFLLNDIVKFITDPKGNKTVFASQDEDSMKELFGPCQIGEGFYLNVEADQIQKVKFIKQEGAEGDGQSSIV